MFYSFIGAKRRPNACLTCISVPKGLGVKIAERSDRNFHAKGNVWFKQLLGLFFLTLFLTCYFLIFTFLRLLKK